MVEQELAGKSSYLSVDDHEERFFIHTPLGRTMLGHRAIADATGLKQERIKRSATTKMRR